MNGFQYIFWDERIQDFRIPTHDVMEQISSREETKYVYDIVVNVFKAHGLSIVAALAAEVPGVAFSPMDADNVMDVIAAKKAEAIGKMLQKYNKSKLLFYHALFTLYTNYFVAAYNYYERDEKYGFVDIPKYKKETRTKPDSYFCPECEFKSDIELLDCPDCSSPLEKIKGYDEEIEVADGKESISKGMEKFIIKGTLNVKIPIYAADQDACGYLIDYTDQHFSYLRYMYPNIDRQKLSVQGTDNFERIARMPSIGRVYSDSYTQSLLTLKRVWLRPQMFDILDKKEADELKQKFPKGAYFAAIDGGTNIFAEAREEKLDDHWTVTKGDLSRAVHGDPLGKPLLPLQDLENTTINLLTESLEHSVPTTFADPEVLDFETYSKQEVSPGAIYPIKNSISPNRRLEDYFFNLKTSTLPKEGVDFGEIVESKGQFVVGAFPSIFGGPQSEGSKTLGEYQESRSYALQRLSIPYQFLYFFWSDTTYKGVKDYIRNMVADEKHTIRSEDGKFASVHLLMDQLQKGRFDCLQSESAVDLPVSFSQKRSTLQGIIQLNSETLNSFLFSPENRKITLRFLGMEELSDLDSNQVTKQLYEIEELLKDEPILDPLTGERISSISVEPEIDDNVIHRRVLKTFLSGDLGREHKLNNPLGYENCLLHAREHKLLEMQEMMMLQSQGKSQIPVKEPVENNV